ncbi:hypothetical protein SARC_05665 [Sphaeroforma arctica JP610]|uniref:Tryptophan--tRNA ligase, cytoplasmic n=1 Tax=Sphaeroforma arctica JP610 TaxID=667725 RepID=A0A0L0G1H8_9EUKA|nr:hypothetical protein SARC_05665 [Sphaeroforma arctica JP610]KNC82048.1 hypothetical protein SARC_05665 [Sphaeroforma arctica JP610]|eukprot:XP_014155950.1 hypothetical protein SARC_05665 [Sphaeroforma arctica JP610]
MAASATQAVRDLDAAVETQAQAVRKLKENGASKDEITAAVDELKKRKADLAAHKSEKAEEDKGSQKITPWDVQGAVVDGVQQGVDYNKLIDTFGCSPLPQSLIERFEQLTGRKAHMMLRRGMFYAHREFDKILDLYEKKKPFYLYTGRGPSSDALHMGHMVPFIFCQYLQEVFDVPIVIQMTDDEKFLFKDQSLVDSKRFMRENVKDIISVGFNPDKTFIFSNMEYIQYLYPNILEVNKKININQLNNTFGFDDTTIVGKVAFPPVQMVPCFSNTFPHIFGTKKDIPCLIPAAIDQDPYFRLTRNIAGGLKYKKCCTIYSKFFPALQGAGSKMSASVDTSAIFTCDTPKQIAKKVKKYAFSGGRETLEEHREKGGDCEVDVAYQYLTFFLDDDVELRTIHDRYSSGEMLTSEVKDKLIEVLVEFTQKLQARRATVTDAEIDLFCSVRPISYERK